MTARVLLTGATAGIGQALARRFAGRGEILATGRRSEADARAVLPDDIHYVCADQADPEAAAAALDAALDRLGWRTLDLAVLNAAVGYAFDPAEEPPARIRETLDANLVAPVLLARHLFPRLERTAGKLVLIGSTARRGAPSFAAYAASKAGLYGFARALAQEWQGRVSVQMIDPGPTATDMHRKAGFDPGRLQRLFLRADTVAAMIEDAMRAGRPHATVSWARFLTSRHAWRGGRA